MAMKASKVNQGIQRAGVVVFGLMVCASFRVRVQ